MYLTRLYCFDCGVDQPKDRPLSLCTCGGVILCDYDLERARIEIDRAFLPPETNGLWRYAPFLPVRDPAHRVTLGEGGTPLIRLDDVARELGIGEFHVKDEGLNPTGTFKARGMSVALSLLLEKGVREVVVPTAGNAGGALAAYAAKAGIRATVVMPADAPLANKREARLFGASVEEVAGNISNCGARVREIAAATGAFDVSTLKEPGRIEGKKTMGYEILEQLRFELPDWIMYPTGGGTGLIGIAKAFDEMERLGWIGNDRPRFVAVQAEGCAPVVRGFAEGLAKPPEIRNPETCAAGLRVPKPFGYRLMIDALRRTNGRAVAVPESAILRETTWLMVRSGLSICPESGACVAAVKQLVAGRVLGPRDRVVLVNTGSALKYLELFSSSSGAGNG